MKMSFNQPFDVFGQTMSQGVNAFVTGIKSIDNFSRSSLNTLGKGIPSPQNAINSLMSLPQSIMPKGSLALPNLGAVGKDVNRNLALNLPNLRPLEEVLPPPPGLGAAGRGAADTAIFGGAEKKTGLKTRNGQGQLGDGSSTAMF